MFHVYLTKSSSRDCLEYNLHRKPRQNNITYHCCVHNLPNKVFFSRIENTKKGENKKKSVTSLHELRYVFGKLNKVKREHTKLLCFMLNKP